MSVSQPVGCLSLVHVGLVRCPHRVLTPVHACVDVPGRVPCTVHMCELWRGCYNLYGARRAARETPLSGALLSRES